MTPYRNLFSCGLLVALLWGGLAGVARAGDPPVRFDVQSDFGEETDWVEPYLEEAAKVLIAMMDDAEVRPPERIPVKLTKVRSSPALAGYASPTSLGFSASGWPKEKTRLWILAHELTNLFACHYAGSGGFPSDWWSNGRSPFPEYVSCLVMRKMGYEDAAAYRKDVNKGKPDHVLYWKLHEKHGFEVFPRFFRLLREDGVDLGKIGEPWPRPDRRRSAYAIAYLSKAAGTNLAGIFRKLLSDHGSKLFAGFLELLRKDGLDLAGMGEEGTADSGRSLYAAAYLSIAAGENLSPVLREHGVGKTPPKWNPAEPFSEYEVTNEDVDQLIERRAKLFDGKASERARERFRRGSSR